MSDVIDDDSLDIELRPVADLLQRLLVLAAIAERGILEVDADHSAYERETDRFERYTWVRTALAGAMSDSERDLLSASVGSPNDDLMACDEALIGASSIAWALGVVHTNLPVPHDGAAESEMLAWLPAPWSNLDPIKRTLNPLDEEVIASERERWELWYWRANDADDAPDALAEVVAELRVSGIIPVADNDLATHGANAFASLSQEDQAAIAWLAEHRLRTLNWVCGFGHSWDDAPTYPD